MGGIAMKRFLESKYKVQDAVFFYLPDELLGALYDVGGAKVITILNQTCKKRMIIFRIFTKRH